MDRAESTPRRVPGARPTQTSRMGFASHPGTAVDPTCSILAVGRIEFKRFRIRSNWIGHFASYGTTLVSPRDNPWLTLALTRGRTDPRKRSRLMNPVAESIDQFAGLVGRPSPKGVYGRTASPTGWAPEVLTSLAMDATRAASECSPYSWSQQFF